MTPYRPQHIYCVLALLLIIFVASYSPREVLAQSYFNSVEEIQAPEECGDFGRFGYRQALSDDGMTAAISCPNAHV